MSKFKIYVASSWRNVYQPNVVKWLRELGYAVYDFRGEGDGWGEGGDGAGGFGWKEVDPNWQNWVNDIPAYLRALSHPRAEEGFLRDMNALRACDICVMVNPCGQSAHLELGWACGTGKVTVVYCPEIREPDLMIKAANFISHDWMTVARWITGMRWAGIFPDDLALEAPHRQVFEGIATRD